MKIAMKSWTLASRTALGLVGACFILALTGCEDGDSGPALQPPTTDLSGAWKAIATTNGEAGNQYFAMSLNQSGNTLAGLAGDDPLSGTISGNILDLTVTDVDEGYSSAVIGSVNPGNVNQIAGTWSDQTGTGTWRAQRN
jgi:hypothetical protein